MSIPQNRPGRTAPSPNGHASRLAGILRPADPESEPDILSAARRFHARGLWVVPCHGKKAAPKDWQTQRVELDELVADLTTHPRANIGVILTHSPYVDVECDNPEAEQQLLELCGGELPPTPTYRSSRGLHRWFLRPPDELPDKAVVKVEEVEVRIGGGGKGAASVVPPSVHPDGTVYTWLPGLSLDEVEPAPLPPALLAAITRNRAKPTPTATTGEPVREGSRNKYLFALACRLFGHGLSDGAVAAAVRIENAERCAPPLSDSEVAGLVRSASTQSTKSPQTADDSPAATLLRLAEVGSYWHTPDGTAYATFRAGGRDEHHLVRSRAVEDWLAGLFYRETRSPLRSQALEDVVAVLESRAKYDGEEHPVFIRVAPEGRNVVLDLATRDGGCVRVEPHRWRVVPSPPVRFRRPKGMLLLPAPERGGDIAVLWRFLNVAPEHRPLVLGFLVACFRPAGPYPLLVLRAEHGSGKTTAARVFNGLIDPSVAPVCAAPRGERDLVINANNSWLLGYDNLSYIDGDLSDALCRLASGATFRTRKLYSDDDEALFSVCRPVILNGIEDVLIRSDLMDRAVIVELPPIDPKDRKAESEIWVEFEQARPRLLGALVQAVSVALRRLPQIQARRHVEWPRMADFAQWVTAAEPGLGLEEGEFLRAYEANRAEAHAAALESSPLVVALRRLFTEGKLTEFDDTATILLKRVSIGQDTRIKGWPQNPRALSSALSRLAPNLRAVGFGIEQHKVKNEKRWRITPPADLASAKPQRPQKFEKRPAG